MKEATGELNMTVITVVAIAAVAAFFYAFVWPNIQMSLARNTCANACPDGELAAENPVDLDAGTCTCADGTTIDIDTGDE